MQISLDHPLFQAAIPVMERIERAGYEAYFVGGAIRDSILNRPIHDVDIASSALPEEIEDLFETTIDLGKAHGTIIVIYEAKPYEVTTFRTEEGYSDFRRPDEVHFVRNLQEDTLRRDFTINALAADRNGQIYDYHDGLKDMEAGLIRAVGNPAERFKEDSLRTMRALRFASDLGFQIEKETYAGVCQYAPNLEKIAVERIRVEMSKLLMGEAFPEMAFLLVDSKVYQYLPGLNRGDLQQALANLGSWLKPLIQRGLERDERLVWALLIHELNLADQGKAFLKEWTFSNQFIKDTLEIQEIVEKFLQKEIDLQAVYAHQDDLLDLVYGLFESHQMDLPELEAMRQELPIKRRQDLVVDGHGIMKLLGKEKGGREIGQWLERIESAVINGDLENDGQAIAQFIRGE